MKVASLTVIFLLTAITHQLIAGPTHLKVVHTGPSSHSPPIATLYQQPNSKQVAKCSRHVDPNGAVWTQVRVQGWVRARHSNRVLMNQTGANQWKVVTDSRDTQPMLVTCKENPIPICRLQPFAVVCGNNCAASQEYVYASFTGWVMTYAGNKSAPATK